VVVLIKVQLEINDEFRAATPSHIYLNELNNQLSWYLMTSYSRYFEGYNIMNNVHHALFHIYETEWYDRDKTKSHQSVPWSVSLTTDTSYNIKLYRILLIDHFQCCFL
jgi:hypothetical protein